jgi:hypothetical protein
MHLLKYELLNCECYGEYCGDNCENKWRNKNDIKNCVNKIFCNYKIDSLNTVVGVFFIMSMIFNGFFVIIFIIMFHRCINNNKLYNELNNDCELNNLNNPNNESNEIKIKYTENNNLNIFLFCMIACITIIFNVIWIACYFASKNITSNLDENKLHCT